MGMTTGPMVAGLLILLVLTILPPLIIALIVHLTLSKKYKQKKKWIISISTFLGLVIPWGIYLRYVI